MTDTQAARASLTFDELRLATLLTPLIHPDFIPALTPHILPAGMDMPAMTRALADQVIQTDRLAAALGIDLAAAIRERFDSAGRIRDLEPLKEIPHDLERKRSGA